MKNNTDIKIVEYIKIHQQATTTELVDFLGISRQAVFKQLKKLFKQNKLIKIGSPPKVLYVLSKDAQEWVYEMKGNPEQRHEITDEQQKILNENYLYISPFGYILNGVDGFVHWCLKTNQPIEKTAIEYIKTFKKYHVLKNKDGFINGFSKIKSSFKNVYLNELFYLDFYSIERFGKTKLGQMLLYAKQSQNKKLIKELTLNIRPYVHLLLKKFRIDGVGFIPPTVKREVQLMHVLAKNLDLQENILKIIKMQGEIAVPQKSLNKIQDRIENAKKTIYITEKRKFKNILLIDDAVGSGATLNETAKKIRQLNICSGKIIGLALTGSYKGFDVISEV